MEIAKFLRYVVQPGWRRSFPHRQACRGSGAGTSDLLGKVDIVDATPGGGENYKGLYEGGVKNIFREGNHGLAEYRSTPS